MFRPIRSRSIRFRSVKRLAAGLTFALTALPVTAVTLAPVPVMAAQLSDTGAFRGADSSHPASGNAKIIRLKGGGFGLKLQENFNVRGGPDLRVWLSEASDPRSGGDVRAAQYVDLGRLKSSDGAQIYRIPDGTNLDEIGSVVIWCRAFSVFFGSANLA